MSELIGNFNKMGALFDFRSRSDREQKEQSFQEVTEGEEPNAYATKTIDNQVTIRNGSYPNLVISKTNTTYNCLGDVTFKSVQANADCKISGGFVEGTTTVPTGITAIFNDCVFNADITVVGNAHFIGCLFKGGTVTNTGTAYIIGCSNKSGSAHAGITATYGETT